MIKPKRVPSAAAFLAVLLWTGVGLPHVGAQEREATDGEIIHSWAMAPTGADPGRPGSRSNFSYELARGAVLDDSVTLWNLGTEELAFEVYPSDAFNNLTGDIDVLAADKAPTDIGTWVAVAERSIVAPPGTTTVIPFRISVPPDARPGDHVGAILASNQTTGQDVEGRAVNLDRRVAARVYLRVAGPLEPAITVEEVHAAYRSSLNPLGGSAEVSYTVRNTGNVRLGVHQKVQLKNPFGRKMKESTPADIGELLPGNAVTLQLKFEHVTAALLITPDIDIEPFPVGQPGESGAPDVSRNGRAWAIPWSVIAAVLILGVIWYRIRNRGVDNGPDEQDPPAGGHDPDYVDVG